MPKSKNPHGIFCLETIWFDERSNPSTRSLLELLYAASDIPIPFVYRDISTFEELDFCLGRWMGRSMYKKDYQLGDFGILYLGFHGSPGEVYVEGDLRSRYGEDGVNLNEIAESLIDKENIRPDCSGTVVHFSSCSVLGAPSKAEEFMERIGAAGVSGYKRRVESTNVWAFELMYLIELSHLMATKNVNAGTLGTLLKKLKSKPEYAGLANSLGFTIIHKKSVEQ